MKTGCLDLDSLVEYPNNKISIIYGEGGSGKTTLGLLVSIQSLRNKKKVLYIDVGNNFSVERFNQLSNDQELLKKILIIKIKNFKNQHEQIKGLLNLKVFDLIVIDSFTTFYRRLYSKEPELAKAMLNKQLNILKELNTTIILTSEVYSDINTHSINSIANKILKRHTKLDIKLTRNPRKLFIKQLNNYFIFKIKNEGIFRIRLLNQDNKA